MNKVSILQQSALFNKLLPAELETLAEVTQERRFEDGENVVVEGDTGDALYIIVNGLVEVLRSDSRGEEKSLAKLSSPDFFGEMALIDKNTRSATVRVIQTSTMLVLPAQNLHSFAKIYRDGFTWIAVNIARVLSLRLRETNRRLAENGS